MARCIECREEDRPGRIVEISYCGHRACMEFRRPACRDIHMRSCVTYCTAVGWTPVPPAARVIEQGALFDLAVSA